MKIKVGMWVTNYPDAEAAVKAGYDVAIVEWDDDPDDDAWCHLICKDEAIAKALLGEGYTRVEDTEFGRPRFITEVGRSTAIGGLRAKFVVEG